MTRNAAATLGAPLRSRSRRSATGSRRAARCRASSSGSASARRERPRDFDRLVVTALAQPRGMQRHRRRARRRSRHASRTAGASSRPKALPSERAPRVFQLLDVAVERRRIGERRHDGVDVPGRRPARATVRPGGPRPQPAHGLADARQIRRRTRRRSRRRSRRRTPGQTLAKQHAEHGRKLHDAAPS